MNLLGLVFSLLLIISYVFFACWEKQNGSARLRNTYISHQKVQRKILRHYESELYSHLRQKSIPTSVKDSTTQKKRPPSALPKNPLNQECARLNLWPLIQKGREEHQLLYETAARMLRIFYAPLFERKSRFEYFFLDQLLKSAKTALQKESLFQMEKIAFQDPQLQLIYYKMLKGTKKWDLPQRIGYPSLLDYIQFDSAEEKICLFHAHPDLLAVFFGFPVAGKLYSELHKENPPPITAEFIETLCSEAHITALDPEIFSLLALGRPAHKKNSKITLIEEDPHTHLSLRKSLPM